MTWRSDELTQEGVEQVGPIIGSVSITSLLLARPGYYYNPERDTDSRLQFQYIPPHVLSACWRKALREGGSDV